MQLWNDSSFNPTAPASDCHSDYQSAVNCSYEVVAGPIPPAPQKIEDVFTSLTSDLHESSHAGNILVGKVKEG